MGCSLAGTTGLPAGARFLHHTPFMNDREPRCPRCGEPFGTLKSQTVCLVCGETLDWHALADVPKDAATNVAQSRTAAGRRR